jgi:GTPase SAR1 family protein
VHNQSPKSKQVLVIPGQIPVRLILWDVDVSSPEYEHLRPQLYRDADVVLICFALDDFESLTNVVDKWHPDVLKYAGKSVPVNLVGLKQDLRDRQVGDGGVSYDEGVAISKQLDVKGYFECSARLNTGVDEVFQFTARFVCDWNEGKRKCTIL